MIKSGLKPNKIDHRDWDFHKSFGTILGKTSFPANFTTDAGLTMPNQELPNIQFTPTIPALPFGCTSYVVSELAIDLGNPPSLVNPMLIENVTRANASRGYDLRKALLVGVKLGLFAGIFNVKAYGQDMFDACTDAQLSGGTEKRSVAIGSEWLPPFETITSDGILPMPNNFGDPNLTWHAWKLCGRVLIGDQEYQRAKSWQGQFYGDQGYCYFSRPLFNQLMSVPGSVAFTATRGVLPPISTISVSWWVWLISNARNLLPY